MTETVFEKITAAVSTLKLDFSSEEFALYAEEHELSEVEMTAVASVFAYLSEKKQQTSPHIAAAQPSADQGPKNI